MYAEYTDMILGFTFTVKSCLRSYTKWESYRKHVQRGCAIMPSSSVVDHASSSIITPPVVDDISMDEEELPPGCCNDAQDWYEAAYVLKIKEQHILCQVALDQIVSCTRTLVSDILNKTLNDVQDFLPANALQVFENSIAKTNSSLFKHLTSAALQKKYFKQYFNLVVSEECMHVLLCT